MGYPMRDLCQRTKSLALRIVKMYAKLPKETVAQVLGKQVLRSGTSIAANTREASRARSDAEFLSKLGVVEGELDETLLWLELLTESGNVKEDRMAGLHNEAEELLKIVVASIKTKKRNNK
jgi:four helix bundle protein